jgi:hypothetical protein
MIQALTIEQVRQAAPTAFVENPAPSTSQRYSFIPTSRIIEDMDTLGWKVREAKGMKSTGKNPIRQQYGAHMIRFFHPDIRINNDNGIEAYPEILIKNNSMGVGKVQVEVGVIRLACSNGMVIKSMDLGSFKLRHRMYTFQDLQTLVNSIIERLPIAVEKINRFAEIEMTPAQMRSFATKALQARLGEDKIATDQELNDILKVRREADQGNTLWTVFNRLQESIVRGGEYFVDAAGKMRKMKPVKNFAQDLKLNGDLWEVAEEFAAVA